MTHTPTTAAYADCKNGRFTDPDGTENPNRFTTDITVTFNGATGTVGEVVSWPIPTAMSGKQAAVRARVNKFLAESQELSERGIVLSNAVIEMTGIPT